METAGATYFVTFRCRKGMEMPPVARAEVLSAIQHWDGKRIQLDAAVVMSDHAHALFRISDGSRLGEVLHSIKSFSANQINTLLNRTGAFWLDENFDHIVRHAAEWEEKFEYIRQNPVKKDLADVPDAYPFLYPRNHRLEACATVEFEVFEPKAEKDVPQGTVTRAKATCVACGAVLPPERVRAQLSAQRGGADVVFEKAKSGTGQRAGWKPALYNPVRAGGARMLAVVTLQPSGTGFQPVEKGRHYRLPTERDYEAVRKSQERLAAILGEWEVAQASSLRNTGKMPVPQQGLCPVPDEPTPAGGGSGAGRAFSVQRYGMLQWGDLFTARQKMALVTLARLALEQVVAGTAPEDYRDPAQFFARTCFTRALREHAGMVLRRLSGKTENTAPVLTLITQFGGGKTHTLTALYHLAKSGDKAAGFSGVSDLLTEAGLSSVPEARVAVFVGNAWDPQPGRETPWIDIARQLADDKGVEALGQAALTTPPGTEAIARVFQAAGAPVLLLFDEVLNFMNRHRGSAESFHAFIQNLTVATIGTTHGAAMISLPRSQVEMTEWDQEWQDRISKVVRRVAKDLIANDETEISEVVRRRLFQDLGSEKIRKNVAKAFGDWCFERRAQLPPEWTTVDTAATEAKAREFLQRRFESCYPFHPATLSVFQRKWQALSQYQQTRGTLAMLAQWISIAAQESFRKARTEPLITLGSAPLAEPGFRSVVLGQLGESRLVAAIDADIAGEQAHTKVLDADTKGPFRDIHRRVGTAILFESSGGQSDKVAHLPELRFALGEPELDTTSIDNAALALEARSYFIRKAGSDGFRIGYLPTMKKVVSDRRASLDEETEVKPAMRKLVEEEFRRGASIPVMPFPGEGAEIPDTPRLSLVVADPEVEWDVAQASCLSSQAGSLRHRIAEWTRQRGKSPRLYPGALVWCLKKPGRDLREKIELWLAWKRVAREVADGTFGGDFDKINRAELQSKVKDAEEAAKDGIWGGYRFAVVADSQEPDGLKVIDLGAGHSSSGKTQCGRVIEALKSEALLNESVGASYIERNWPPALKESGAWPLASLRQSFLNGSLTRLVDPDAILRGKIVEFVSRGEFGLASGLGADGTYERVWFQELVAPDEVAFEAGMFLLRKVVAEALKSGASPKPTLEPEPQPSPEPIISPEPRDAHRPEPVPGIQTRIIRLTGTIPPEVWNRLGTKILPRLRSGTDLKVGVELSATVNAASAGSLASELRQILQELGLADLVRIDYT